MAPAPRGRLYTGWSHGRRALLTAARRAALSAQVRPHFLFNTLHAISTLIEEDPPAAQRMLASRGFVRIHRSAVVRADRVRELTPLFHGGYRVVLADGTELKLTRTYRAGLERLLSGG